MRGKLRTSRGFLVSTYGPAPLLESRPTPESRGRTSINEGSQKRAHDFSFQLFCFRLSLSPLPPRVTSAIPTAKKSAAM